MPESTLSPSQRLRIWPLRRFLAHVPWATYARVDLNPMPEPTLSPIQRLRIWSLSRLGTCTMSGQIYARVDPNHMPESTLSPSQGLRIYVRARRRRWSCGWLARATFTPWRPRPRRPRRTLQQSSGNNPKDDIFPLYFFHFFF
jgi:hypothetical protein